jgi:hypothetical protein
VKSEIGFNDLSLFCKIGVCGGVLALTLYVVFFIIGFVEGFMMN